MIDDKLLLKHAAKKSDIDKSKNIKNVTIYMSRSKKLGNKVGMMA